MPLSGLMQADKVEICWVYGQPRLGGCGCLTELHLSAFGRLSVSEPAHQLPRGARARLEPTRLSRPGDALTAERALGRGGVCCLCWAQSLGLACSPAQDGALALPAEPLTGAAASDGPRTDPGSLRDRNGTRMLQCPGMLLFHRAVKDLVQPGPEAPASRASQVMSGI